MSYLGINPAETLECCGGTVVDCKCGRDDPAPKPETRPCIDCGEPTKTGRFCDRCFVAVKL